MTSGNPSIAFTTYPKMTHKSVLPFIVLCLLGCNSTPMKKDHSTDWAENQIWYQIFVERFNNGDSSNDPVPENMLDTWPYDIPADWTISPWISDWYAEDAWMKNNSLDYYGNLQLRRYGGDLQGVLDKLNYLEELGITAIYFNPVNDSPSLHKYGARYYHHIDIHFGPDPEGDKAIIASEDPNDPSTWKWTSADKLFLKVVDEAHKKGMRVIVDFSWNHVGIPFWAFQDVKNKGINSEFKDWFEISSFDDPTTEENEFDYYGWLNINDLPELKKVNAGERKHGHPYSGNLEANVKQHIFDVSQRWLAPNGDIEDGIDGFRLDVADQIPMEFWKEYRAYVKSVKPSTYLVGEIWWEEWPDKLMDPRPYLGEAAFDAVMYYQVFKPARGFFGDNDNNMDAAELKQALEKAWKGIEVDSIRKMMSVSSTHDTPRLLTSFNNPNKYKFEAHPRDHLNYKVDRPSEEAFQRTKLYLMHQFTSLSSPHIWNGDEMGMWGGDDPDCRKPLWWPELTFDNESMAPGHPTRDQEVGFNTEWFEFYKSLIALRKAHPALHSGSFEFELAKGNVLAYSRTSDSEKLLVIFNLDATETTQEFNTLQLNEIVFGSGEITGNGVTLAPLSAALISIQP